MSDWCSTGLWGSLKNYKLGATINQVQKWNTEWETIFSHSLFNDNNNIMYIKVIMTSNRYKIWHKKGFKLAKEIKRKTRNTTIRYFDEITSKHEII